MQIYKKDPNEQNLNYHWTLDKINIEKVSWSDIWKEELRTSTRTFPQLVKETESEIPVWMVIYWLELSSYLLNINQDAGISVDIETKPIELLQSIPCIFEFVMVCDVL